MIRVETLKRHLPFSGLEGALEIESIAVRFEEKIYSAATSQVNTSQWACSMQSELYTYLAFDISAVRLFKKDITENADTRDEISEFRCKHSSF